MEEIRKFMATRDTTCITNPAGHGGYNNTPTSEKKSIAKFHGCVFSRIKNIGAKNVTHGPRKIP